MQIVLGLLILLLPLHSLQAIRAKLEKHKQRKSVSAFVSASASVAATARYGYGCPVQYGNSDGAARVRVRDRGACVNNIHRPAPMGHTSNKSPTAVFCSSSKTCPLFLLLPRYCSIPNTTANTNIASFSSYSASAQSTHQRHQIS